MEQNSTNNLSDKQTVDLFRPALKKDTEILPTSDGGAIVRGVKPLSRIYVEPGLQPVLILLDGNHSVRELVVRQSEISGRPDFITPVRLLRNLLFEGLIEEPPEIVRKTFLSPVYGFQYKSRFPDLLDLNLMIPLKGNPSAPKEIFSFIFSRLLPIIGTIAFIAGLVVSGSRFEPDKFNPVRIQGNYDAGLLVFILGMIASLTFRGIIRIVYLWSSGIPASAVGIRIRAGIPFFDCPGKSIRFLPSDRQGEFALAGMGALTVFIALALSGTLFSDGEIFLRFAFAAFIVLMFDLCPFVRSDLSALLQARMDVNELRFRTKTFLLRRFILNTAKGLPVSQIEKQYLSIIVLWALYVALMAVIFGYYFVPDISGLLRYLLSMAFGTARHYDRTAGFLGTILLLYFLVIFIVSILTFLAVTFGMIRNALMPIFVRKGTFHGRELSEKELQEAVSWISGIEMFSGIDRQKLSELAHSLSIHEAPQKTIILHQGEEGDRIYFLREGTVLVQREEESGRSHIAARLSPVCVLGETAILREIRRSATIWTETRAVLYSLTRDSFLSFIEEIGKSDPLSKKKIEASMFLQKHPAFAGFETDGLTKILQKASFRSCKQGEIVFYEGESAENLYFIMSGKCRALKGKEGETRIVAELSAGDHFGEIALLRNRERTATIQAVTDCDLVVIEAEDFLQSLNSSLQFGLFFDQTSEERIESGQNIQRGKS